MQQLVLRSAYFSLLMNSSTSQQRNHAFSTYEKISEKLNFLTPDTHTQCCPHIETSQLTGFYMRATLRVRIRG